MSASPRSSLALALGRGAGWASRATGRGAGAQISGRIMLGVDPHVLERLGDPYRVVLVSATNGKTTTTRLLVAALEAAGHRVVTNATGANLASGIAAALAGGVRRSPRLGDGAGDAAIDDDADAFADDRLGPPFAVLEVDERVVPRVVEPLRAELLVLGNLSRDQLDRYGEVHALSEAWRAVTTAHPGLGVVANASDPHVVWAAAPAAPTWVALGSTWTADAATCPRCQALLHWDADGFTCASCGFAPPPTPHRLDGDDLLLGAMPRPALPRDAPGAALRPAAPAAGEGPRRLPIKLTVPGRWNLANAALAAVAAAYLDVDGAEALAAMEPVRSVAGRYTSRALPDGRDAHLLLAKNPAGWAEVIRWLEPRSTGVVIAVNAHVADGRDPSWLWDVPYERLRGRPVAAAGERRLDVAVRLRYAGIDCVVHEDALEAAAALDADAIDIVASYTQFTSLLRRRPS